MTTCLKCGGEGIVVTCWDDICVGGGYCIHGDGEAICPECGGDGEVGRDDDELMPDDDDDDVWHGDSYDYCEDQSRKKNSFLTALGTMLYLVSPVIVACLAAVIWMKVTEYRTGR